MLSDNDPRYELSALDYVSGLLRMREERNLTTIGRIAGESAQNIQHFTSCSLWQPQEVVRQVREEISHPLSE